MLTHEKNETLTRTGPGTPMGRLMRSFWTPAMTEAEIPAPDEAPVRLQLLGENLVVFRDSEGRVHLWLGRRKRVGRGERASGLRFDIIDRKD